MELPITGLTLGDYDLINLGCEQITCILNNIPPLHHHPLLLIQPVFEELFQ